MISKVWNIVFEVIDVLFIFIEVTFWSLWPIVNAHLCNLEHDNKSHIEFDAVFENGLAFTRSHSSFNGHQKMIDNDIESMAKAFDST